MHALEIKKKLMECTEIYSAIRQHKSGPVSRLFVDGFFYAFFTVAAQPQTKDVEKHSCQQLTVLTVQRKYNRVGN